jgi:hypothetical protein
METVRGEELLDAAMTNFRPTQCQEDVDVTVGCAASVAKWAVVR